MKFFALSGLLLTCLIFLSLTVHSQVFFENFSGEPDNAVSGTAVGGTWTTTTPTGGVNSFSRDDVGAPYGGIIAIDQTGAGAGGEGIWQSNVLNISALGEVALEVVMGGANATAADYVRAFYRIDGGAEVMFAEVLGSAGLVVFTASSAVVSGNTLQIVIRGRDNSGGGGLMGFDDVTVTDIAVLYSRANAAWNALGTWSITGFGGASCGCLPTADSRVIIGNNRTVTMPADGNSAGVEIQNTGTLQWSANNVDLTLERGGALNVQSGGLLTRVATTGSSIAFGNYTYANTNAGTINIGVLAFNVSGNSTFTNSGTLTLATATGLVINGGNGYVITNSGTINLAAMDLNTANITINNSGTINQTGNFTDVDAGSAFNNLVGGIWNFGGTTVTSVRLFASNNSNTFNYNGAGAQSIITPQDSYSNLELSGGGVKTALGNFSVRGDWTRSGTATFAPGAFRVSFTGTIAQTISGPAPAETFANLTINNSFATSPQITLDNPVNVTTNLTMTAGNINLDGNTFTISPNTAGALTHNQLPTAGWMYGGSLVRSFPTTAIAVGNVAGFYPLGGNVDFRPFLISKNNIAASNGTITIAYTNATSATNIAFADGVSTIQRRHDSFWTVTKTGVTAGTFAISAGGTGFTIGAVNQTRLTRSSDATGIGTAGASTGTAANVRVHRTGLTAAQLVNNFYLASTNSVASPLPVELIYFRARIDGDEIISTWKTAQEKNNHFFEVQKTTDFETFYEVGRLDGKGNSGEEHIYTLIDDSPFSGKSYYRLKQVDFDGTVAFSDPVMVNYDGPLHAVLNTYPNPFNGKQLTIEIKGLKDVGVVPLQIFNLQGQKVMDIMAEERGPGIIKEEILFPIDLPQGVYIIKAGKTLQLTRKVFVSQ